MSVSTDACFFFGILEPEEGEWQELRENYATKLGLDFAWGQKMDEQPVQINSHCSLEYPMYYICARTSYAMAWRGEPHEIDPSVMVAQTEQWTKDLRDFCELMDIKFREPKFYIASNMG